MSDNPYAHVQHWPPKAQENPVCNWPECNFSNLTELRYYACGLRCPEHKPGNAKNAPA